MGRLKERLIFHLFEKLSGGFAMGKWAVIYSSVTGNTKMVAEKIAEAAEDADLFAVDDAPRDLSGYEVVALGYWLRLGAPDPKMLNYMPQVHDTTVVLFQTHGTDAGSEHAVTAFARAGYLLGENCGILGTFGCQGKINPAMIEKRRNAGPGDPHGGAKAIERWKTAASHPDAQDLSDAAEFTEKMKHKLVLRKQYLKKHDRS